METLCFWVVWYLRYHISKVSTNRRTGTCVFSRSNWPLSEFWKKKFFSKMIHYWPLWPKPSIWNHYRRSFKSQRLKMIKQLKNLYDIKRNISEKSIVFSNKIFSGVESFQKVSITPLSIKLLYHTLHHCKT